MQGFNLVSQARWKEINAPIVQRTYFETYTALGRDEDGKVAVISFYPHIITYVDIFHTSVGYRIAVVELVCKTQDGYGTVVYQYEKGWYKDSAGDYRVVENFYHAIHQYRDELIHEIAKQFNIDVKDIYRRTEFDFIQST